MTRTILTAILCLAALSSTLAHSPSKQTQRARAESLMGCMIGWHEKGACNPLPTERCPVYRNPLAWATVPEQCSTFEYLSPEQWGPGQICEGVRNPFLAEARKIKAEVDALELKGCKPSGIGKWGGS